MKIDAIILARKNSKRLKNKNFKNLNGKEVIDYSLDAAINAKNVSRIYCYCDKDLSYKKKKYKNKIIFLKRPASISKDSTTTEKTLKYLLKKLSSKKLISRYFILLQASSPLRSSNLVDKSISIFLKNKKRNLATFKGISKKIYLKKKNKFVLQKKTFFHRDGAIFILNTSKVLKFKNILSSISTGLDLSKNKTIDIDTKYDFEIAKNFLKNEKK